MRLCPLATRDINLLAGMLDTKDTGLVIGKAIGLLKMFLIETGHGKEMILRDPETDKEQVVTII